MNPFLSLVVPAYNEARRLERSLPQMVAYLAPRYQFEIVVVDDGSVDETPAVVQRHAATVPEIRLIQCPSQSGKGAAVRRGMLEAGGQFICFSDADLSTPIAEIDRIVQLLQEGQDVVIGSRALPDSRITVRQHLIRETMGKTFNGIARWVLPVRFADTQCGFKGFKREVARAVFSRARIDGFAFDVEILLLADALRFSIAEMPVQWEHTTPSRVHVATHPFQMLSELWRIRNNFRKRAYGLF